MPQTPIPISWRQPDVHTHCTASQAAAGRDRRWRRGRGAAGYGQPGRRPGPFNGRLPQRCPGTVWRCLAAIAAAGAAAALLATAGPAAAQGRAPASSPGAARAVSGGTWGTAIEVPGTAALNTVGLAYTSAMSCASAGNCSAGGHYTDGAAFSSVFVASQVNGRWGTAKEVPGIAALNTGGFADIYSASCASAGNCSAGGFYIDSSGHNQAFVVSQAHGTWGTAEQVPGTAALNQGGAAFTNSVSCAPAGTCIAGGYYTDGSGHQQAFVAGQG